MSFELCMPPHLPSNLETTHHQAATSAAATATTTASVGKNIVYQISFLPAISINSITEYLDDIKMSRRRAKEYDNVDYTKLAATDNGFIDAQFVSPPEKVPWKAVVFAGILLIVGSTLLVLGSLVVSGHIDVKYSDRMWPMIILGILMFIPGAYHVRIAYYAYKEVPGYSFDDIPEFD